MWNRLHLVIEAGVHGEHRKDLGSILDSTYSFQFFEFFDLSGHWHCQGTSEVGKHQPKVGNGN